MNRLRIYMALSRLRLSFVAALSAMAGYLLPSYAFSRGAAFVSGGIFLLACGASALNQYQERNIDALMERTRMRPLPTGAITGNEALSFSILCIAAGLVLLYAAGGVLPVWLGVFAVIWYNGLYTSLKKRTAFAAVPGALIGAIPPAAGWSAAGGTIDDPVILLLCIFFFLWQVPHFWLIAAQSGEQYRKAGLKSMTGVFSLRQLSRVTFIWIVSTAVLSVLFIPFGLTLHRPAGYLIAAASAWIATAALKILGRQADRHNRALGSVNLYLLIILLLLLSDRMF